MDSLKRLTSVPDTLRHMYLPSRICVSAGKTSILVIGTAFALTKPKKRTTPPVFAFELAATRIQALAAFFRPPFTAAGHKPLICKEMAENKPFPRLLPVNKL
jgi:hypothetical protein